MNKITSSIGIRSLALALVVTGGFGLAVHPAFAGGKAGQGDLVLCTNWGDDTVSLVDINEGRELATIKVGHKPYDVKVDAKGRFAYVSSSAESFISVIDIQSMLEAYRIRVGPGPREIDMTADGKRAVVTNSGDDSISVVDLEARNELYRIPVGAIPYGIGLGRGDHLAVVSNWGESTISIVDIDKRKELKRLPSGALPYTVIVSQQADFALVTNFGAHQAMTIDLVTLEEGPPLKLGRSPWGGSITPDGKTAFIANFFSNELSVLKIDGGTVTADGKASLASTRDKTRTAVATETVRIPLTQRTLLASLSMPGEGRRDLPGLSPNAAPDGRAKNIVARDDGALAVSSDLANNQLLVIDITARKVLRTIPVGHAPYGVAFLRR